MRNILLIMIVLITFNGCFWASDKTAVSTVIISQDKSSIVADNLDSVNFSVIVTDSLGNIISNTTPTIYVNDEAIEGMSFNSITKGTYDVYASVGGVKSNSIEFTVENGVGIYNSGTIEIVDKTIDIISEGTTDSALQLNRGAVSQSVAFQYSIKHLAKILPMNLKGQNGLTVQANQIIINGNKAYISYNYAGDEFKGAIQIIDITKADSPVVSAEIRFTDKDINCIYLDGNKLLFGGAADPDYNDNRSFVGMVDVSGQNPMTPGGITYSFFSESYGATGITKKGDKYYVGIGAKDGGIIILDGSLTRISPNSLIDAPDIRDISVYESGVIAVEGTTDNLNTTGNIVFLDESDVMNKVAIENFNSPYNKATLQVYEGNTALLGLSEAGFQAFDLSSAYIDSLKPFFTFPNPDTNPLHVTNGVSFDAKLIFTANGEYGFRVLNVANAANKTSSFATSAGYYPFENNTDTVIDGKVYSANYVAYRAGYLFVASGVGGVNIYTLTAK